MDIKKHIAEQNALEQLDFTKKGQAEEYDKKAKAFTQEYKPFFDYTQQTLKQLAGEKYQNLYIDIHDSFVKEFSQKKDVHGYKVNFECRAFIYKDKEELGTVNLKLNFDSKSDIREISGKDIYNFILTPEQDILLLYIKNNKIEGVTSKISNLEIKVINQPNFLLETKQPKKVKL